MQQPRANHFCWLLFASLSEIEARIGLEWIIIFLFHHLYKIGSKVAEGTAKLTHTLTLHQTFGVNSSLTSFHRPFPPKGLPCVSALLRLLRKSKHHICYFISSLLFYDSACKQWLDSSSPLVVFIWCSPLHFSENKSLKATWKPSVVQSLLPCFMTF